MYIQSVRKSVEKLLERLKILKTQYYHLLSFQKVLSEPVMIQMSVSELANLKTEKWTFPVFHELLNRDFDTKALKIASKMYLEPYCWARTGKFSPAADGLLGRRVHSLIYRGNP